MSVFLKHEFYELEYIIGVGYKTQPAKFIHLPASYKTYPDDVSV